VIVHDDGGDDFISITNMIYVVKKKFNAWFIHIFDSLAQAQNFYIVRTV